MSQFVNDAFFIGVKEGTKLSLCVFLLAAYFSRGGLTYLKKPLFAGIFAVFLASFAAFNIQAAFSVRDVIVKMIGYVFGLFYLFSLGALFHSAGEDNTSPFCRLLDKKIIHLAAVLILTVIYFVPDMAGSSLYLSDLFAMSGKKHSIFTAAGAGFAASLAASHFVSKKVRFDAARLLGLPQALLFLSLIKLVAGGVRGFAELSLIPSVQAGLMKLIHDAVHQTFVILMVPDHPVLSVTSWNVIAILFGTAAGLWLSLIIFTLPLILFIKRHFTERAEVPAGITTGAQRRKFLKSFRDDHILKALPIFAFLIFIAATWFVQRGETAAGLYNPEPKPLAVERGVVTIALHGPSEDLLDGSIHKYTVNANGEDVRLLIMKKPDGTLAVCLDACEICRPDGYGQAREHVICLYCNTPIPFDTLGKPGGCNPIPLSAIITEKEVKIGIREIADKRMKVKSGDAKEGEGK